MAAYQDRFADFCDRVRERVPEEHQQEAPPEIARPFMEAFASTSDNGPLMAMFEELMAKAIDDREAEKLSPSFPEIIRNLSPLEAKLIVALTKGPQQTDDLIQDNVIVERVRANFQFSDIGGQAHHLTIAQSLQGKSLVKINFDNKFDYSKVYPNLRLEDGRTFRRMNYSLTMFGQWFSSACVRARQ